MMRTVRWFLVLTIFFSIASPSIPVRAFDSANEQVEQISNTGLPHGELTLDNQQPALVPPESIVEPDSVVENDDLITKVTISSIQPTVADNLNEAQHIGPIDTSQVVADNPAPTLITRPSPIPATGSIVVSALQFDTVVDAIELRNVEDRLVDLSRWSITVVSVDANNEETACSLDLSGYLLPKQYMTIAQVGVIATMHGGSGELYEADLSCGIHNTLAYIDIEEDDKITESLYLEDILDRSKPWVRKGFTNSALTGVFTKDFSLANHEFYVSDLYVPPDSNPLKIIEINTNPVVCELTTRPECLKYIKVINSSDASVDLSQYRLRAGTPDKTSTSSNTTRLSGYVTAGETAIIVRSVDDTPIYLASSDGSVWFQDRYGLKDFSSEVTPYLGADKVANKGRSWALDDSDAIWKWAIPSPYTTQNNFIDTESLKESVANSNGLTPCREGQYRSEETNRCRNIVSSTSQLSPCKEGQYRSEETNRCRSIATLATATLKACADDQFRNPITNRCKKIASSDELALADCGEGRERNPETNRCRNVQSMNVPEAAFAVEPIKEGGSVFIGWWTLGGIGIIALGYGVWEWRREILSGMRRVGVLLHLRK